MANQKKSVTVETPIVFMGELVKIDVEVPTLEAFQKLESEVKELRIKTMGATSALAAILIAHDLLSPADFESMLQESISEIRKMLKGEPNVE